MNWTFRFLKICGDSKLEVVSTARDMTVSSS